MYNFIKNKPKLNNIRQNIFNRFTLSRVIIIFIIGLLSRITINYFHEINVFREWDTDTSLWYYALLSMFIVIITEAVNIFKICVIPTALVDFFTGIHMGILSFCKQLIHNLVLPKQFFLGGTTEESFTDKRTDFNIKEVNRLHKNDGEIGSNKSSKYSVASHKSSRGGDSSYFRPYPTPNGDIRLVQATRFGKSSSIPSMPPTPKISRLSTPSFSDRYDSPTNGRTTPTRGYWPASASKLNPANPNISRMDNVNTSSHSVRGNSNEPLRISHIQRLIRRNVDDYINNKQAPQYDKKVDRSGKVKSFLKDVDSKFDCDKHFREDRLSRERDARIVLDMEKRRQLQLKDRLKQSNEAYDYYRRR